MRKNNKSKRYIFLFFGLLLVVFFGKIIVGFAKISPFFFELIFKREINLKTSDHNVNILLLGIGGKNHEGPNLTDTIIFTSISFSQNKVTMVSIPRDLWMPDLKAKINTAYSIGEEKRKGGGLLLAKAAVQKILKQPVDYAIRIDFDGFVKAVDELGGLTIEVEREFYDYEYPIEGKEDDPCGHAQEELAALATASSQLEAFPCRYKTVHFKKGLQKMDGKTALAFARSRHAKGEEGSDFARSKRQEKIIKAFKDKIFSIDTVFNPARIINLYNIIKESVDTDIEETEFDDFARLAQKLKNAKIESTILDAGDKKTKRPGFLINPPVSEEYNFSWVLIPRTGNGDFSEIQRYADCVIKSNNCQSPFIT